MMNKAIIAELFLCYEHPSVVHYKGQRYLQILTLPVNKPPQRLTIMYAIGNYL